MQFRYPCLNCHINQVIKIADMTEIKAREKETLIREVLVHLSKMPYDASNPKLMAKTCEMIYEKVGVSDPYSDIKKMSNDVILEVYDRLKQSVYKGEAVFNHTGHMVVEGNIIDYAAGHTFNESQLAEKLLDYEHTSLKIDHLQQLEEALATSKKLLYICDNCGEIVLDKLFIEVILEQFPQLDIIAVVRGKAVLNDATLEEAKYIGLDQLVRVIDNGSHAPGTVLDQVSETFMTAFREADVIISKGQGNYESLSDVEDKEIYFMLMAKCELVAKDLGVDLLDKVCINKNLQQ